MTELDVAALLVLMPLTLLFLYYYIQQMRLVR